jgi:hypothetical protein
MCRHVRDELKPRSSERTKPAFETKWGALVITIRLPVGGKLSAIERFDDLR